MDSIVASAHKLQGLIDFQADSVVSKTIIDTKEGTITLFAFDKGQGLSEHTSPYNAFVYSIEGSVEITIDGKPHTVSGGEVVIMPANKPHSLHALERFKMLLVLIRS